MQAQSNATERSFWHIRAKLIVVWTYFGCFEALLQQACLWRSSNLCWVRSKSKTKNQQPMKLRLAGNFIRSGFSSPFTQLSLLLLLCQDCVPKRQIVWPLKSCRPLEISSVKSRVVGSTNTKEVFLEEDFEKLSKTAKPPNFFKPSSSPACDFWIFPVIVPKSPIYPEPRDQNCPPFIFYQVAVKKKRKNLTVRSVSLSGSCIKKRKKKRKGVLKNGSVCGKWRADQLVLACKSLWGADSGHHSDLLRWFNDTVHSQHAT